MKKKLTYIVLSIVASAFLCGCNTKDFLSVTPSGVITEDILLSVDGLDLLINSAYAGLMTPGSNGSMSSPATNWSYGEVRADNAYKGGGNTSDQAQIHNIEIYTVSATDSNINTKWNNLYYGVYRCNAALNVLKSVTAEQVPNVEVLKAEMRALRAYFYFELQRLFNQIPWILDDVDAEEYAYIRNDVYTRDQLLGMIAKEFEDAAAILPETQKDLGRMTKYAAYGFAAKTYLYKAYVQDQKTHAVTGITSADLEKVVDYTSRIINSGKFKLFDDWQKLDMLEYENGEEFIFEVQYSFNDGSSRAGRTNNNNLLNLPQGPYSGDGFYRPSQDLVNAYQTDDNGLPLLDGSFQNKDYDLLDTATEQNLNIDGNVDPRLDFVVGRANVRWKTYEVTPCMAYWMRAVDIYGNHVSKRFCLSPESPNAYRAWPWFASGLNWSLLRYANILLWKAEALIELGRQDEARPLINEIRNRAKNSPWVTAWDGDMTNVKFTPDFNGYAANYVIDEYPASGWTKEYAREALRFETRLELALEGERFFDLVRWGVASEVMTKFFEAEKDIRVYYGIAEFVAGKDEYYPIPTNQWKYTHDSYVQNNGYSF